MRMKLFLSVDMEGISGIVDTTYINPEQGMNYQRGRQLMTADTNAVIEAALEWGVTEIVVADSHNTMNNILIESLHPQARLICGSPRDTSMMHGLDASFDAAFFIGYHTRQGTPGVLSHTMSHVVRNMYVNDLLVGEFGFNAIYAGLFGVPVCLVSGDDRIAQEAREMIPGICTAVVKRALSRTSALCFSREESEAELKRNTRLALDLSKQIAPVAVRPPLELRIEFSHAGQAEMAAIVPGTSYEHETCTVRYTAQDPVDLYKTMRAMINLADTVPFF